VNLGEQKNGEPRAGDYPIDKREQHPSWHADENREEKTCKREAIGESCIDQLNETPISSPTRQGGENFGRFNAWGMTSGSLKPRGSG